MYSRHRRVWGWREGWMWRARDSSSDPQNSSHNRRQSASVGIGRYTLLFNVTFDTFLSLVILVIFFNNSIYLFSVTFDTFLSRVIFFNNSIYLFNITFDTFLSLVIFFNNSIYLFNVTFDTFLSLLILVSKILLWETTYGFFYILRYGLVDIIGWHICH